RAAPGRLADAARRPDLRSIRARLDPHGDRRASARVDGDAWCRGDDVGTRERRRRASGAKRPHAVLLDPPDDEAVGLARRGRQTIVIEESIREDRRGRTDARNPVAGPRDLPSFVIRPEYTIGGAIVREEYHRLITGAVDELGVRPSRPRDVARLVDAVVVLPDRSDLARVVDVDARRGRIGTCRVARQGFEIGPTLLEGEASDEHLRWIVAAERHRQRTMLARARDGDRGHDGALVEELGRPIAVGK